MTSNKRLLLFIDWYLPAYKAGGPIVAASNFVEHMKDLFDIYVFTGSKDLGDIEDLPHIIKDRWQESEQGCKVYYASSKELSPELVKNQIKSISPDYIYLHSMFSLHFTIYPLLVNRTKTVGSKFILAPRGMLRKSALQQKALKKKLFLGVLKASGLCKGLTFHATDEMEHSDIRKHFGFKNRIVTVPDFGVHQDPFQQNGRKMQGSLKMIFIGRIHPIKNLLFLFEALRNIKEQIQLTILGNLEDEHYWDECLKIASHFGSNIQYTLHTAVPHSMTSQLIRAHHLMVLPTQGENFGHAIYESLSYGTPVLISDQTMWRNLSEVFAGMDIPLNVLEFTSAINKFADMGHEEWLKWSEGAWNYCKKYRDNSDIYTGYHKLFP